MHMYRSLERKGGEQGWIGDADAEIGFLVQFRSKKACSAAGREVAADVGRALDVS